MQRFPSVKMRLSLNLAMRKMQIDIFELKTPLMSTGMQVAVQARARFRARVKTAEEAPTFSPKADDEKQIKEMGAIPVTCYAG
eukprot:372368-Pyramimonas_sp.AAC.1